jgi:hypothetical protein
MPSSLDMSGRSFFGDFPMPRIPDSELSIVEASSFRDYLFLRTLRNQIRNLMTNNTEPIGYLAQLRFYISIKYRRRAGQPVRIFIARHGTQRAGYLLIRESDDGAAVERRSAATTGGWESEKAGRICPALTQIWPRRSGTTMPPRLRCMTDGVSPESRKILHIAWR